MGNIELDLDGFSKPLKWAQRSSLDRGFLGKLGLLCFGVVYFVALAAFLLAILPLLWLYDRLS